MKIENTTPDPDETVLADMIIVDSQANSAGDIDSASERIQHFEHMYTLTSADKTDGIALKFTLTFTNTGVSGSRKSAFTNRQIILEGTAGIQ